MNSTKTCSTKCVSLLFGLLVAGLAHAATIKTKAGAIHEGKIAGLIVLKGRYEETPSEKNPGQKVYTARYVVVNGHDLEKIDEQGVHLGGGRVTGIFSVEQEGTPLDDLDVVHTGLQIPEGGFLSRGYTKAGGSMFRMGGRAGAVISRDTVLGEYREDREKKESVLRPIIEIETAGGVVKVPVAELVELKPEA